jgi:hypothetical protein
VHLWANNIDTLIARRQPKPAAAPQAQAPVSETMTRLRASATKMLSRDASLWRAPVEAATPDGKAKRKPFALRER